MEIEKNKAIANPFTPSEESRKSSRLPGFYDLPPSMRAEITARTSGLSVEELRAITNWGSLSSELVDVFIENGVGSFALPLGVATNFLINDREILVPMAVEETSVLAAASHGAKLARGGGGFRAETISNLMTGQVQVFLGTKIQSVQEIFTILESKKQMLLDFANRGQERLLRRGGGAKEIDWHYIPEMHSLVLHLYIDTQEAMGANIVNTMCERVAKLLPEFFDCEVGLRILSNLCDRRITRARCTIPAYVFDCKEYTGSELVDRIEKAFLFAYYDPYRAATHNKGVMNGIDPVLIATGNDWRAVEAGVHAYACRDGKYRPVSTWKKTISGDLEGSIELPLAVGTVGGVTKLHPGAQACLKMMGSPSASELAEIVAAVGLAQNLSALRALASEGIQKGHMGLHQKNLELLQQQQQKQVGLL